MRHVDEILGSSGRRRNATWKQYQDFASAQLHSASSKKVCSEVLSVLSCHNVPKYASWHAVYVRRRLPARSVTFISTCNGPHTQNTVDESSRGMQRVCAAL